VGKKKREKEGLEDEEDWGLRKGHVRGSHRWSACVSMFGQLEFGMGKQIVTEGLCPREGWKIKGTVHEYRESLFLVSV
jgi:hypothetical protein